MFISILDRIYTGFIALGILFLSGYTGNDVQIGNFEVAINNELVVFSGSLIDAFEHDFEEIFLSGLVVTIIFDVRVTNNKNLLERKRFTHSVYRDIEYRHWVIYLNGYEIVTVDYAEMKEILSRFNTEFIFNLQNYESLDFHVTAQIQNLRIPTRDKELELMLLWKRKVPSGKTSVQTQAIR